METGLFLLAAFILYREWRFDRERAAWTKEREALVNAAARTNLGVPPPERKQRPKGDAEWAEAERRRKESRELALEAMGR